MTQENTPYAEWIGRISNRSGLIDLEHTRAIAATFNHDPESIQANKPLPLLWHWCFLLDTVSQSNLAQDGHAQRGEFLPPVELPRRMWAGSRIKFHEPILIANSANRQSVIKAIKRKKGNSGELLFVTVEHSISQGDRLCLVEEQDLVYREESNGKQTPSHKSSAQSFPAPQFSKQMKADTSLLFRYSAVTFNAHRIHYDRDYATGQENYPGLLVHGPLLATLLMQLLNKQLDDYSVLSSFIFRALAPVYDLTPFTLCGKQSEARYELWVNDQEKTSCLQAEAYLRKST